MGCNPCAKFGSCGCLKECIRIIRNINWLLGWTKCCCSIRRLAMIWCRVFSLVLCSDSVWPWMLLLRAFQRSNNHLRETSTTEAPHMCALRGVPDGDLNGPCAFAHSTEKFPMHIWCQPMAVCVFNAFGVLLWIFRWVDGSVVEPIRDCAAQCFFQFGQCTKSWAA